MTYLLVRWLHALTAEPILLYSELDGDRFETRKVEIFRGGKLSLASADVESDESWLSEKPVPPIEEIAASPEFVPQEIGSDEFESIWQIALHVTGNAAKR